jgi:murein DD-endopeptidase MepM/ murein hydrolase activator NlpD
MKIYLRKNAKKINLLLIALVCVSCSSPANPERPPETEKPKIVAESFASPVGEKEHVTEAKDARDEWYNAQDFGENRHLGEDWNKNSGGDTDCGEPVYAAANGTVTYAEDAGAGWGNVVIIEHELPDGRKVQTLYGHLDKILKTSGTVKKREQIGTVGNADGEYLCHLHFELRDESCLLWNKVFVGYSPIRSGWLDPSDFIDERR